MNKEKVEVKSTRVEKKEYLVETLFDNEGVSHIEFSDKSVIATIELEMKYDIYRKLKNKTEVIEKKAIETLVKYLLQ